jgi:universal stress protein E
MFSNSIRRILVAIKDPTVSTPSSVIKAAQLAHALNAELVLFHGIDVPLYAEAYDSRERDIVEDEADIRAHLLHNLTAQAAPVKREGLSISCAAKWDYPPHESVLRHAQRIQADLVVTERHPHGSAAPWALHSTDWELLRLSPKPVLVVKDSKPYQRPVILAALDPFHRHAKPAELDAELCALAQALSRALDGAWHALHASSGTAGLLFPGGCDGPITTLPADARRDEARAAMNRLFESVALRPQTVQLRDRPPAEAIVETAEELHASMVVMGAMSRSGLKRVLIGNTAERVIDRLQCDVLVVKPKSFGIHFSRRVRGPHMLSMTLTPPLR